MAPAGRRASLGRGARERILTAAAELFARQGFNATGVNDLHKAARVSKRTLYQHFQSKDDLIIVYLAQYGRAGPTAALLRRDDLTPRTRLLELFTALADPATVVPDPLIAAAAEFPSRGHRVHQAVTAQAEHFTQRLTALARAAQAPDPERTARRLATLYDGACSRMLVDDVATVVSDAYAMAAAILREAID
ncbi:MAG TPA: helix-turn-helix domain-containing protein [Solirubrobacteraceae bacterium]|nr:helix-turn-helix domain-containing protein [Solirubrobacteraceae bacterium]